MRSTRVPSLDLLRALAVAMVIGFHFSKEAHGQIFEALGQYGWMGVDLFFVLSGYLICTQMFQPIANGETLKLRQFYLRRWLRTLPIYFIILLIYFCFSSLRERPDLPPLWKFLTFTQNLGLDHQKAGAFSHAWSLCVEEQFYLLLPLVSLLILPRASSNRLISLFAFLFAGGIFLRAGLWHWLIVPYRFGDQGSFGNFYDKILYFPTYTHLDGLLVGVALGLVNVYRPQIWQRFLAKGLWALTISGVLLIISSVINRYSLAGAAFIFPLVALGFGALLIASLSPQVGIFRRQFPGVQTIALLSYGIYLIQKLVFHLSKNILLEFRIQPFSFIGFFLTVLMCVGLAIILHLVVERPFLKLRDRLIILLG